MSKRPRPMSLSVAKRLAATDQSRTLGLVTSGPWRTRSVLAMQTAILV